MKGLRFAFMAATHGKPPEALNLGGQEMSDMDDTEQARAVRALVDGLTAVEVSFSLSTAVHMVKAVLLFATAVTAGDIQIKPQSNANRSAAVCEAALHRFLHALDYDEEEVELMIGLANDMLVFELELEQAKAEETEQRHADFMASMDEFVEGLFTDRPDKSENLPDELDDNDGYDGEAGND